MCRLSARPSRSISSTIVELISVSSTIVELISVGPRIIQAIKIVRLTSRSGLKEAKDFVDNVKATGRPTPFVKGLSANEADDIQDQLRREGHGAIVTVEDTELPF
jgi:ribosomal protein L7/L12